jgi:hypothetical protein
MTTKPTLTPAELAVLDAMITAAQEKGKLPGDHLDDDDNWWRMMTIHKLQGGRPHVSDEDLDILKKKINELGAKLKLKPTLQHLIKLRNEALRSKK